MKWHLPAAALAAGLGLAAAAGAAQKLTLRPGMTGVPDLGAISCATLTHMHPAGPTGTEQALLTWAQGYLYARTGQTMDEILAGLPADAPAWTFDRLAGHLVEFCAANPEAQVPEAAADLARALGL